MATSKWRYFFWIAALFNLLAGLPPMLAPVATMVSSGLPAPEGVYIFYVQVLGEMICVFGLGYALIALGRPGAAEIAAMGAIGKLALAVLLALQMQHTAFPPAMIAATMGDVIFACLFIVFIFKGPSKA